MAVICEKHGTGSKVSKIPGGVRFSCLECNIERAAPDLLEALEKAKQFIENGIELGYIRMPDAGTPDSAHKTLPMINAAIAKARGQ